MLISTALNGDKTQNFFREIKKVQDFLLGKIRVYVAFIRLYRKRQTLRVILHNKMGKNV